jgi:hypothetical protein
MVENKNSDNHCFEKTKYIKIEALVNKSKTTVEN